jgi:hypothetical protein
METRYFTAEMSYRTLNAGFDIAFLNAELACAAKPPIATERVVDTLGAGEAQASRRLMRALWR